MTSIEHISNLEGALRTIEDLDPRTRLAAVSFLAAFASGATGEEGATMVERLRSLVGDKAPFIRWNLAIALGQIRHDRALELLDVLAGDAHANVRIRVALAVGLIGDARGLAILERLAGDAYEIGGHFVVREFAALALGRVRDERAVAISPRSQETRSFCADASRSHRVGRWQETTIRKCAGMWPSRWVTSAIEVGSRS